MCGTLRKMLICLHNDISIRISSSDDYFMTVSSHCTIVDGSSRSVDEATHTASATA